MPTKTIQVEINIDPTNGDLLEPVGAIFVPQQASVIQIFWSINGATFDVEGISLVQPLPPASAMPNGQPLGLGNGQWTMTMLNNVPGTTNGNWGYVINYIWNGQNRQIDPTIDNQPPPG